MLSNIKKWFLNQCPEYLELQQKSVELYREKEAALQSQNNNQQFTQLTQEKQALQTKVNELQQEIALIRSADHSSGLTEKVKQLAQIQAKTDALEKANQELRQHVDSLQKVNESLNQKIDSVEQLEKELEEKENALHNLTESLEASNAKIDQLSKNLREKATEISRLEGSLGEKDGIISQLETSLVEKTTEISRLNGVIEKNKAEIGQLQTSLEGKETEIRQLDGELEKKKIEIGQLQTSLEEKETEISRLNGELEDKKAEIGQLQTSLKEKEKKITQIQSDWAKSCADWEQFHNQEMKNLNTAHNQEMQQAKDAYAALQKDHAREISEICQKIEVLKADHQKALNDKDAAHKAEMAKQDEEHQKALKAKDEALQRYAEQRDAAENNLLGKNIADVFRKKGLENPEMRRFHLFLSLIYACDLDNNPAGVQNLYLLLDDHLRIKYQDQSELAIKRQFIRELFNANVKSIKIDELPEIGKNKLEYNQSKYTFRGKGDKSTSLECPCLVYNTSPETFRPGLIYFS